ncbi:MAG: nucleotidyltransferase family protein [Pseudomonadota bacterium]|nr:nucleotidyltransferase family protein [Pseudomonadota bacterium]
MPETPKILVLAGRRSATLDPMAEARGVSHKCVVPVGGVPMIERVLRVVDEAFPEAPVFVSIEDFDTIRDQPTVAKLAAAGRINAIPAQHNIVDSVTQASRTSGFPLIITTADNVLMTAESLHRLADEGRRSGADALVVVAEKQAIRAAHPDGQRRFYEFKDGGYSNCNMFWLGSPRALGAAEAFREGGQFAKKPERIIKAFGILNLIRYRMGRHSIGRMFEFISRRFKVDIRPLIMEDGRLAIDVDNERTHRVAEEILAREGTPSK